MKTQTKNINNEAVIYCRVSSKEQEDTGYSLPAQEKLLREYAQRKGLTILKVFSVAESASGTKQRKIFGEMMEYMQKKGIQILLCEKVDRLTRNLKEAVVANDWIEANEERQLHFVKQNLVIHRNAKSDEKFRWDIEIVLAKKYIANLSEEVRKGQAEKIAQGWLPAKPPLGYKMIGDKGHKTIAIDFEIAPLIQKMFELYATGKYTLHDMCMYFYENGIRERNTGEPPETTTVREVFKRPFYYGYMLYNGELYQGTHTPIITKDTFDKVQLVIQKRGWFHTKLFRAPRYDFAFTGFIKCHYCGCSVTAESRPFFFPKTNNRVNYLYYHCTKKKGVCCQKGYTREEVIAVQFREMISSLSVSEAWVEQMNKFLVQDIDTQKVENKSSSSSLETEISQTEQKLDTLLEAYLDTVIDSESYIKKKNELMERKANLVSKQKELVSDNPNWIEAVTNFITCAQKCAKIARAENNCHDLADMAKKVGSKYFLKDKKIEFCLYFPYNLLAANGGAASFPAQFVPTLAFSQSKYYVDSLSENTKRGLRQKARNGFCPGPAPIGYLNDSRSKTVVLNKKVSPIIKEAFEYYSCGNVLMREVSSFLAKKEIHLPNGKSFGLTRIRKILTNSYYYGHFVFAGEVYEGRYDPIISKQLFDKVQEIINRKNKQWSKARVERIHKPYLGLLRCGECGMGISGDFKVRNYKNGNCSHFNYYRCTKKSKVIKCLQPHIREEDLDNKLITLLKKYALRNDWAIKMNKKLDLEEKDIAQSSFSVISLKRKEIDNLNSKLQLLLDSYLDQITDKEMYKEKKLELIGERKTFEEQIINLQNHKGSWIEPMRDWITEAGEVSQIISGKDKDDKKVLASKIFGSNLYLENKKVRGDGQNAWSALCADPTSRKWEPMGGIEPPTLALRKLCSTN